MNDDMIEEDGRRRDAIQKRIEQALGKDHRSEDEDVLDPLYGAQAAEQGDQQGDVESQGCLEAQGGSHARTSWSWQSP